MPEYRVIVFWEVIRAVYDENWERYESVLMWTSDPLISDIKTGGVKERLVLK